ncbi:hypothetical protein V6N11_082757 [Hibiscus sabdariffa]|uniref:Uncharacterized protein n=1 Tax=Hibiscus sabdariffa TaxID=183260 RepID=A0ABR2QJU3_9ROSI
MRVIERLNDLWLYWSQISVALAQRRVRNSYWWRKRGKDSQMQTNLIVHSDDCMVQSNLHKQRQVFGGVDESKVDVLSTCAIGRYEMVGVVDYVVDERCAGMESTLCMIRVIEREDAVHKAVNEGLVTEGDVTNAVVKKNSNALGPCYIDIDFGLNSLNRDYVVAIDVEQVDNAMVPYIESNFVFLGACVVRFAQSMRL